MISMKRTLLPGLLAALWLGASELTAFGQVEPPPVNSPASYRLFNTNTMGPRTSCGRCDPVPWCNPGFFLNNPRGTGPDDPWRPPHCWPQTRYPVVPAYTRPSYGYYETSWRLLQLCNPTPTAAGPIYPAGYESNQQPGFNQPQGVTSPASATPGQANPPIPSPVQGPPLPRPPIVPPAVRPAQQGPPAAVPPAAPGGATVPTVPLQPQKEKPPTNELQPQPPKATPPATPLGLRPGTGAVPEPQRDALLDLQGEQTPEIRVQPF